MNKSTRILITMGAVVLMGFAMFAKYKMHEQRALYLAAYQRSLPKAATTEAAIPADQLDAVKELLVITKAEANATLMLDTLIASITTGAKSSVDKSHLAEVLHKALKPEELMTACVIPIWCKHFNVEDLKGLVAFYKTPLGQRVLVETPTVLQESMHAGQQFAQARIEEILRKDGI